ncbi:glycosyltransferase (plasmid) [Limimaricola variabilis]|uniref:glycosyltransferase family 4 protein n=1 Tax=Limimaricola variabilis TaxID=1492771 RepID=UPI002AC996E7|nr:glycosyltransferase [Limimaricola variabilis]WPY96665.1 glycosyltransferase [Limimaricola variabilis]
MKAIRTGATGGLRVVVINDASLARGGATGLALLQARLLRERGIEVVFAAGDSGDNAELRAIGVDLRALGGQQLIKAPRAQAATRGIYNPAARRFIAEIVEEMSDARTVFHVHGFSKTLSPSIFAALAPVRARSFLHAHDFFLACPNGAFMDYRAAAPCSRKPLSADCLSTHCDKRSYAQKLWRVTRQATLWRTLERGADWAGLLMIHPAMRPFLEMSGYPPGLLTALRNPAIGFREERVAAEANRGVVFVGRVEAEKGIEDLVAAAARAGVSLTVIGDGPLRESLEAAHPEVRFLGWMSREQIGAAIGDARALVMPSRYPEPFGLVAAEASLSGLPVILGRHALLGTEIERLGLGLACDTRDPVAFAATLARIDAMPAAEIEAISRRGHSGAAGLCTTPAEWIEAQIGRYRAALEAPARAA